LKREGAIANIKSDQGGRKLKREGAIADIKVLTNPDQSLKHSQQKDDNINDLTNNRYYSLIYLHKPRTCAYGTTPLRFACLQHGFGACWGLRPQTPGCITTVETVSTPNN